MQWRTRSTDQNDPARSAEAAAGRICTDIDAGDVGRIEIDVDADETLRMQGLWLLEEDGAPPDKSRLLLRLDMALEQRL